MAHAGLEPEALVRMPVQTVALKGFVVDLLGAVGVSAPSARAVADGLVDADIEAIPSHGVILLPMYIERIRSGSVSPNNQGRVVSSDGGAVVLDAENGLGQVTAQTAVSLALDRAQSHGLGAVAVRNGFHIGTLAPWARMMADAGCIGVVTANTRPLMPAPGGSQPVVGNNPIAIAAPTNGDSPIVVDFALSAGAMGKIRLAEASGEEIPEGWAVDSDGRPTTQPAAAIAGMLLPAGGPKGFGLALMVELLAGGLSGGAIGSDVRPLYGDPSRPYGCSHFFLAMKIAAFCPLESFKAEADRLASTIRSSSPAPGMQEPHVPGDRATRARAENNEVCELAASTVQTLRDLARTLRVPLPQELES